MLPLELCAVVAKERVHKVMVAVDDGASLVQSEEGLKRGKETNQTV